MLFQKASPRGYPPSPRGARPEDLQELEDLLRQPGAREAAAEAAAHAESSDDEAAPAPWTCPFIFAQQLVEAIAAEDRSVPARNTEWLLQAEQAHATELLRPRLPIPSCHRLLHGLSSYTLRIRAPEYEVEMAELLKGKQDFLHEVCTPAFLKTYHGHGMRNLQANAPAVRGEQLWWQHTGRRRYRKKDTEGEQFDVVLFADGWEIQGRTVTGLGVYTERGAWLLADAATAAPRGAGEAFGFMLNNEPELQTDRLIGALPDLRAGMSSFEEFRRVRERSRMEDLSARGLVGSEVSLDQDWTRGSFGFAKPALNKDRRLPAVLADYRLILWRYSQEVTAASKRTATPPPKKKEVVPTPRPPEAAAKPAATKAVAPSEEKAPNLKGEWGNIALLCLLYTLQGIPLGLGQVFPLLLKDRGASYTDLGIFSLQSWPFVLKLFWAPLVDSVYIRQMGRRKTWMVPSQIVIGILMLYTASQLDVLLGDSTTTRPSTRTLTGLFLAINFLCATQDIAVDGWALTMLRKENCNYQATCNAAGQTFGYALGFTGFTALEHFKLLSLSGFMSSMGLLFLVVTAIVAILKKEKPLPPEEEPEGIRDAYMQMLRMTGLRPIQLLFVMLFTWKVPFAVCESVAPVKFQEYGIPKEHITYVTSLLMPMYIMIPIVAARWTGGARPLQLAFSVYPLRLATGPLTAILAFYTPASVSPIPWIFYTLLVFVIAAAATTSELMFVSQMAFFAHVSDPALGGTYMTLLNTMGNLGGRWPPTAAFFLVDVLSCESESCWMKMDGFYTVTFLCTIIGLIWLVCTRKMIEDLQSRKLQEWKVAHTA
ncbi:Acetyl-coenzyme A transporter 1 (AT-1) (Acetyl-CoA transporter 1) (Solute carrier family 33 member 1) [Durusdinium trenchii]|uniref:Acetyl-coenzyme A transporter 1 (AT-1) (Acetyl-CoA transporter 1) (Solute carrier family 33 member 1) n=1 Tax=Durusdinium trenchii TaxID=1381693 RepID=A0ABP0N0J8_9DINO